MILGLGTDIVRIDRIEKLQKRFGARFLKRCFTGAENAHADNPRKLAKRFAAKEAAAKALGLGITSAIRWHHFEVVNDAHGAPTLRLHKGALERLQSLTPTGKAPSILISLSDEDNLALAVVVISAD